MKCVFAMVAKLLQPGCLRRLLLGLISFAFQSLFWSAEPVASGTTTEPQCVASNAFEVRWQKVLCTQQWLAGHSRWSEGRREFFETVTEESRLSAR